MTRRWLVYASLVMAFALVVAACGGETADTTTTSASDTTSTSSAETTTTTVPDEEPGDDVAFDFGVTPAPCDDAVNEDNGCIYLGIISDLSDGPFVGLAVPLTAAQEHFWAAVNDEGGIGGFDVIISTENTFDAHYRTEDTVEGYDGMIERVLGFAQILGTPQTQAVISRMDAQDVVAAPANWWSGWAFPELNGDLVLESGGTYCLEAMNGMYFMSEQLPEDFTWGLIWFPGDFGGDYRAGALIAASQLGLPDPLFDHQQIPISAGGDVTEAVTLAATHQPTLMVVVTGPVEMAQIVGGTFQAGHQQFQVLGAAPSWNVALMGNADLVPLLQAVYMNTNPWSHWDADTPGHEAMRAAADAAGHAPNGGYVAGWVWQYPMKTLIEQAVASGDLTRANVRAIAATLSGIDYQGMLPERTYGDPNSTIERSTIIMGVDPESSDGLSPLTEPFVSPIVADFELDGACFVG